MGALHKPNGIAANSYSPECVVEAVFTDSGAMLTCQYPETRSYVEKYFDLANRSRESSTRGRGNASNVATAFSLL